MERNICPLEDKEETRSLPLKVSYWDGRGGKEEDNSVCVRDARRETWTARPQWGASPPSLRRGGQC